MEKSLRLSLSDQAIEGCVPWAPIGPWGNLLLPYLDYFNNLRAPHNFFIIAHIYNCVTKLSSHCSQNFINFKIGDHDLNIFSLIHEREFIVYLVYTVYVYNFTGVQASGVIVIYCDIAVSYGPKLQDHTH